MTITVVDEVCRWSHYDSEAEIDEYWMQAPPYKHAAGQPVTTTGFFDFSFDVARVPPRFVTRPWATRRAQNDLEATLQEIAALADETTSAGLGGVIERVRNVLLTQLDFNSRLPSIAPDEDGGVVLYWVSGGKTVELDVDPDGTYYLRAGDENGRMTAKHMGDGEPHEVLLRAMLAGMRGLSAADAADAV